MGNLEILLSFYLPHDCIENIENPCVPALNFQKYYKKLYKKR